MAHRSEEIAKRVPHDRPIYGVEVGVRYGKNAAALLERLPNLELWMVDRWAKPPDGDSYYDSGDGIAERPPGHFSKCMLRALDLTNPYIARRHIVQMDSSDAAVFLLRKVGPGRIDFVFIDADHSYVGCRNDIRTWLGLVAPGGWIGGHDYGHLRIGEVKRAVDEMFPHGVELGNDMTWFWRIP
jgi:hypothetical protein